MNTPADAALDTPPDRAPDTDRIRKLDPDPVDPRDRPQASMPPLAGDEPAGAGGAVFEPAPEDAAATPAPAGRWLGLALSMVGLAAVAFAMTDPATMGVIAFYVLGGFAVLGLAVTAGLFTGLVRLDLRGRILNERLAAALTQSAETGYAVTNDRGRMVYANAAFMALSAKSRPRTAEAVLAGKGAADAAETDTPAARAFRLARAARTGGTASEDIAVTGVDGDTRQVTVSVLPLPAELGPGTVGQSYALWKVTDLTVARGHLDASEREAGRLAAYLDGLVAGVCVLDAQGRLLYLNAALADWLGIDRDGFTTGALDLDGLLAGARVPLGRRGSEATIRVFDADLKPRGAGKPAVPVRLVERDGETPDGRQVTFVAVHDRRAAAGGDLMDDAEVRFAHFFNNAPIGMATVDGDGRIVSVNRIFHDLAGQALAADIREDDRTGARGKLLSDLLAHEDRAALDTAILAAARGEPVPGPLELRLIATDAKGGEKDRVLQTYVSRSGDTATPADDEGSAAPNAVTAASEAQSAESAARVMVYFVDLTDQKTLEVQFAQSQKMQAVGQLAGGVAHDFNNLLTAIIGFCDLLLVRHQPGDPSFADVMQVKQNANRAANLVRQLLAFSRQQTLRPSVLNPTDALADLSNLLRRLLGETVDLKMSHGRDLWTIKADQNQFEQVIINLAVNARDAMLEPDAHGQIGGMLTIRTANVTEEDAAALDHAIMPVADYVLIEVSDTGCGIPKENLGKIFEPFFSTKEVGKGTGLGLSTVYGIVKQTGGFIFPFSTVGKGTSFRIYLPRHLETAAEKKAAEVPARQTDLSGKGTVLLVEDEDAVRSFAVRALETRGYTVLEAASGEHALEVVEDHNGPIDVVVSDVVMPNMDGPTMVSELARRKPGLKIIFISGYAEEAFKKNLDKDVEFQFLPKPFSLKQLAAKVKEVIEGG